MAKGRGFEDWCAHPIRNCGIFTVLLTIILLIILSFHAVDETEACLTVNGLTGAISEEISSEPGNYFIGIEKSFTCFTKSLQRLDFTKKQGKALYARTRQGLPVEMDITIEYRLMTHELRDLLLEFPVVPSTDDATEVSDTEDNTEKEEMAGEGDDPSTKFSMSYREFYRHLAYAELRNVAAKYTAQEFLSQARQQIAQEMEEGMIRRMGKHHAQVVAFQLRQVYLPKKFEEGIMKIVTMQQEQAVALQNRKAKLETETVALQQRLLELEKARDMEVIEERGKRDAWSSTRAKQLQENKNVQVDKMTQADSARTVALLGFDGSVNAAGSDQDREIIEANTKLGATKDHLVPAATTIAEAERANTYAWDGAAAGGKGAAGLLGKVAADAAGDAQGMEAKAEGEGLRDVLAADVARYTALMDDNGVNMDPNDIVKYVWIDTLKQLKDAKFFVSYKKMPFLMEAAGLSQEDVAAALAGK